jgi:hypothetical protein
MAEQKVTFWAQKWNDRDWQGKVAWVVTILFSPVAAIGLLVNIWGTSTSVKNSKLTTRPYLDPIGVELQFCQATPLDCTPSSFEAATNMLYKEKFSNDGSIPATDVAVDSHLYFAKEEQKSVYKDYPGTVGPHVPFSIKGQTGPDRYMDIVLGRKRLLIRTKIKYTWPGGEPQEQCYETFYEPDARMFAAEYYCPEPDIPH